MIDPQEQTLIAELAREEVARLAPQELPLFRATSQAYFRDPDKGLLNQKVKDDMLGFGVGEAVTLLTPFILPVITAAVAFVAAEVKKHLQDEATATITDLVKRLFRRPGHAESTKKDTDISLTAEQLAGVRQAALEKALQLKMPQEQAVLLADSLVGRLALA